MRNQVEQEALWRVELRVVPQELPKPYETEPTKLNQNVDRLPIFEEKVKHLCGQQDKNPSKGEPENRVHHAGIRKLKLFVNLFVRDRKGEVVEHDGLFRRKERSKPPSVANRDARHLNYF